MKNLNKDIGNYGETLTLNYLKNNGYNILKKNFRNRFGEIDLICRKDNLIIFVEVKSRYNYHYGSPCEAVTYSKQKQIIKLCTFFIHLNKLYEYNCRFDVVEVIFNKNDTSFLINHIHDAFRA